MLLLACVWLLPHSFSLTTLAQHDQSLRSWCRQHVLLAPGLLFIVYTLITAASLPIAALMTMAAGWLFGFWPAFLVISFASTLGASCSFLISRFLLRDFVSRRYSAVLNSVLPAVEQDAAAFLLMLRLAPAFPFFLINLVMGLTPIRLPTFWWASQAGMLPGTAVFVAAGASLPSLKALETQGVTGVLTWQTATAFFLLGCLPIAIRRILRYFQHSPDGPPRHADGT